MRIKRAVTLALAAAPLFLGGCATFHQVHEIQTKAKVAIARYRTPDSPPVVQTVNTPYLLGSTVAVRKPLPTILEQPIHLGHDSALSLTQAAALITQATGIPVHVDVSSEEKPGSFLPALPGQAGLLLPGSQGKEARAFHWSGGTVAQLLDAITAAHRVYWKWDDGRVRIFRTETRTFAIPALDWVGHIKGSISSSSGSQQSTSSNGGPTTTGTGNMDIQNASEVDVWKNLSKVVQTVAGSGAHVFADSSLGTISVTGTPPQLHRVALWVKQIGKSMTRQVAVTIRVYNVKVSQKQNYGLNVSGVFNQIANRYGASFTGASPVPVSGQGTPASFGVGILKATNPGNAQFNGSQIAFQALSTLGNTTQMYSQSAVTLNGQPAPIQVAQNITYLASSTTTQAANVGSSTSLTPGSLTTGFTANILPRIDGDAVLLGINMNLSDLLGIQTIQSGGSEIQAPDVYTDSFVKSVRLHSGETLVLDSYAETQGSINRNGTFSPYFPLLGGGADASHGRTLIVIAITARIL
jgi:type IVB pilus formation R64 PilN family outer membrane protein